MPDGTLRKLEMFSSMGNGFTFPLETILFLAVIRATVPSFKRCQTAVYGDDMVVPREYAGAVIERLEYLGFQVNWKKSCLAGAFFESCGTDWFMGKNVRPFYLSRDSDNPAPYQLQVANALRAWCLRVYGTMPENITPVWKWLKSQIPMGWRNPCPPTLGDVGLHVSESEALKSNTVQLAAEQPGYEGHEGYLLRIAKVKPVFQDRRSFGVLCCRIAAIGTDLNSPLETRGLEATRGLFGKVRTGMVVALWEGDVGARRASSTWLPPPHGDSPGSYTWLPLSRSK
jgi:hypothetical protein